LFDYRKKDGRPLAVASQLTRLAPLKVWFKWMTRRDYIAQDPASELELPRIGYKLPSVLTKDETELVLQQPNLQTRLGMRDRAMLEMLYSTGIRRTELIHLKIYDVDKKHGLVTIREGKGGRDRVVPVGERALFWIEKYLTETLSIPVENSPLYRSRTSALTSCGQPHRRRKYERQDVSALAGRDYVSMITMPALRAITRIFARPGPLAAEMAGEATSNSPPHRSPNKT
jgi:site-specific recombinase XerD